MTKLIFVLLLNGFVMGCFIVCYGMYLKGYRKGCKDVRDKVLKWIK